MGRNQLYVNRQYGKYKVIGYGKNRECLKIECMNCGKIMDTTKYRLNHNSLIKCDCEEESGEHIKNVKMAKEMIGKKFNLLTVLEFAGRDNQKALLYKCKCDCGKEVVVRGYQLRTNRVKSCGCFYTVKYPRPNNTFNFIKKNYPDMICEEWLNNRKAFYEWSREQGYPQLNYLIRKDKTKMYCPENCSFVSKEDFYNSLDSIAKEIE